MKNIYNIYKNMENKDDHQQVYQRMQRIWRHCLESQRESESILSYKESM